MAQDTVNALLEFIERSPSPYHSVAAAAALLEERGFVRLEERDAWELERGRGYYVTRSGSSLIAFRAAGTVEGGFCIGAAHCDSPCFKIKERPEMEVDGKYVKLNVERYGGMLMAPWMDRPLSAAGRVMVKKDGALHSRLVNIDRDLLLIPNVAIHMNREVNEGYKYNPQKDMLPLYGLSEHKGSFLGLVAEIAGVKEEEILAHDLFLYNRQRGSLWGAKEAFVSAPRLDDLQCAFGLLKGFLEGEGEERTPLYCLLDNEEVGSGTRQGAGSTFLEDVLYRLNRGLGRSREDYLRAVSQSFLLSADNAHALHPNHPELSDPVHHPVLNGGIVLKYSANQKYCTDAFSAAVVKELCARAEVPVQTFVNRSDILGGSTLGNIASARVPMPAADIGLPQLAMHSPYETAGARDTDSLVRLGREFFA